MQPANATLDLINDYFIKLAKEQQEARRPKRPPKLLVIDDEKPIGELLERALLSYVDVTCSLNGEQALAVLIAERLRMAEQGMDGPPFDFILLDLKMPGMTGPTVLRRLKKEAPEIMVVICTGYPKSEEMAEAIQIGFFGLLLKPLDIPKMIEIFRVLHIDHDLPAPEAKRAEN